MKKERRSHEQRPNNSSNKKTNFSSSPSKNESRHVKLDLDCFKKKRSARLLSSSSFSSVASSSSSANRISKKSKSDLSKGTKRISTGAPLEVYYFIIILNFIMI